LGVGCNAVIVAVIVVLIIVLIIVLIVVLIIVLIRVVRGGLVWVLGWWVDGLGRAWVGGEFEEGIEEFGGGAAALARVVVRAHRVVEGVEDGGERAGGEEAGSEAAEIVDGGEEAGVVLGPDGELADTATCGLGGFFDREFGIEEGGGGGVGVVERAAGRRGRGAGAEGVLIVRVWGGWTRVVWLLVGLHERRLAHGVGGARWNVRWSVILRTGAVWSWDFFEGGWARWRWGGTWAARGRRTSSPSGCRRNKAVAIYGLGVRGCRRFAPPPPGD
jgi:hypothetical protein